MPFHHTKLLAERRCEGMVVTMDGFQEKAPLSLAKQLGGGHMLVATLCRHAAYQRLLCEGPSSCP